MIATAPFPDALMVPESAKRGRTLRERIDSVLAITEPLLGVDRDKGERAWIRRQGDGWLFITKDPADTIYWPLTSPLRGRDRYEWVMGEGGIKRGYLTPTVWADAQLQGPPDTIKDTA
jgi:hypothetical protein